MQLLQRARKKARNRLFFPSTNVRSATQTPEKKKNHICEATTRQYIVSIASAFSAVNSELHEIKLQQQHQNYFLELLGFGIGRSLEVMSKTLQS